MVTAILVVSLGGMVIGVGGALGAMVRFFKDVREADREQAREDERKRQREVVRRADNPLDR